MLITEVVAHLFLYANILLHVLSLGPWIVISWTLPEYNSVTQESKSYYGPSSAYQLKGSEDTVNGKIDTQASSVYFVPSPVQASFPGEEPLSPAMLLLNMGDIYKLSD